MRHCAAGRHARYRTPTSFPSSLIAAMAALAMVLAIGSATGTFASAGARPLAALAVRAPETSSGVSAAMARTRITQMTMAARIVAGAATAAQAAARTYTVRAGDTLSGIAVRLCGPANDWTGIYAASRAVIGADPNLITAGQRLTVRCTDPPALLRLGRNPARHAVSGTAVIRAGRYGHPYYCGDGDGWDRPCRGTAPAVTVRPAGIISYSGTYSYAGLEALWESAGGPDWAAPHAAEIADCESGGRVNAYNPSGATGLWQILGSVVAGSLYNPYVNALNAVAKFRASGDTFAQWVCQ